MKAGVLIFASGLALMTTCGCGPSHPQTVPVSGVVTYQGKPVVGGQVSFLAEGAARAAYGTTDGEGRFQLSTYGTNDGAVVGTHAVSISKPAEVVTGPGMSSDDPDSGYAAAMAQAAQGGSTVPGALPEKYADPKTSGLTADVTQAGPNEFSFALD